MPAPPHDDTGHTWHHSDDILFGITKIGATPPYAPSGYQSDMSGFGGKLTDQQIWDALAYIKSRWSPHARSRRRSRSSVAASSSESERLNVVPQRARLKHTIKSMIEHESSGSLLEGEMR